MSNCDNSNISFAISMGFLSLIITLWAIFGFNHDTSSIPNPVLEHIKTSISDSVNYYFDNPFKLIYNPAILFVVGITMVWFMNKIMWHIGEIVSFLKKEKEIPNDTTDRKSTR